MTDGNGKKNKLESARLGQETALEFVQKEEAKCRAAMEAERAAKRIAELEAEQSKGGMQK